MTIFDLIVSQELSAYWLLMTQDRPPYLGEELFPANKKLGLELKWIKGSKGLPVVLKPSAFDAKTTLRPRIGFDKLSAEMPFFKESMLVDEVLRQELNMVLETRNPAYIDSVVRRVFDDSTTLLEGAAAQRERMRMMALTTGAIEITANGQHYSYDYGVPNEQKVSATTPWSNPDADFIRDIMDWQEIVEDATGVKPMRAVCDRTVWSQLLKNNIVKKSLFIIQDGVGVVTDSRLQMFIMEMTGVQVVVYNKRYKDESGTAQSFIPAETFVLFPEGPLGNTWFGTTPEESDLMSSRAANVSIVDTGVAVTTVTQTDPVTVETRVTMICLPSFEMADQVLIADVA